jgi:hypothetical protein
MYEAHNMYLQAAVEGGVIAALGLVGFFIWWFLCVRTFAWREQWQKLGFIVTPLVFAAGGLTQNAIQDSEVRYLLMLSCTLCFSLMAQNYPAKN